jgi:hypothetical protein
MRTYAPALGLDSKKRIKNIFFIFFSPIELGCLHRIQNVLRSKLVRSEATRRSYCIKNKTLNY